MEQSPSLQSTAECFGAGKHQTKVPGNQSWLLGPAELKIQGLKLGPETLLTLLSPHPPGERGCAFCGGLGHRITDCPKLEAMQTKQVSNIGRKDYLAHSSMDF